MATKGTPLVEPIPGDRDHLLVTFIWRGDKGTRNVVVLDGIAGDDFFANQLTQLPGTDLFFKSFRAPKDTHTVYAFSPNDPLLKEGDPGWFEHYTSLFRMDPLNPHVLFGEESILRLPGAPAEPWIEARPGAPAGQVTEHTIHSTRLNNDRQVWVYTPPVLSIGHHQLPWVLFFDGQDHLALQAPTMLDNLLASGRIPPLVGIFVGNVEGARTAELTCNPAFDGFIYQELLPWAHQHYSISSDPAQAVIAGFSYGALASAWIALRHPDLFGNVLSQSGAYWWGPGYNGHQAIPPEQQDWLIQQYQRCDRLPLRFYLTVGSLETYPAPWGFQSSTLEANRKMKEVLEEKGYQVGYHEYSGGHDYLGWRAALPEGIAALVGPWL